MIKKCERVIPQKIIPKETITYWKTSNDKTFDTYEEAINHEKHLNAIGAFKGMKKDSIGYWPQNTARYGHGYKHIFASIDTVRDWLVDNEKIVISFYKKIGDLNNETK